MSLQKKLNYNTRRYWYHISTTLKGKKLLLKPWDNTRGFNRTWSEPNEERICVAPSIAHCLTAVPYSPGDVFTIYRTNSKVKANHPYDVFDSNITLEGWIQKPTVFVRIGTLSLQDVEIGEKVKYIICEAASDACPSLSGRVLKWWKDKNLWKYVDRK